MTSCWHTPWAIAPDGRFICGRCKESFSSRPENHGEQFKLRLAVDLKFGGHGKVAVSPSVPPERRKGAYCARVIVMRQASLCHSWGKTEAAALKKLRKRVDAFEVEVCEL